MAQSLVKLTLESNQYEKKIRQAQKSWDDFTKGLGISVKKFTAVGAAIGAVTGALKVAKDAFMSNENTLDEWGRTVKASESLYNGFINSLNNADIGGFLSKMDDIVSAARSAYDAMDELGTYNAFNQVNRAKSKAGYAQALDAYKLNPTAANKAELEKANQAVMNNLREEQDYTRTAFIEELRHIATDRSLSGKQIDDFVDMFRNKSYAELKIAKSSYKSGSFLNAGAQYYYGDRVYDGRIQDRGTGKWRDLTEAEKQHFEFARALSQTNDEQIKAVQALGAQAEQIGEAIYQQDRAYNRLAGNNKPTKPTKPTNTTQVKEQTELQQNQAKINALTQEYVRLGDQATQSAIDRKNAIRDEISQLNERNGKLRLYEENAQGRFLGGNVQTDGFGSFTSYKSIEFKGLKGTDKLEKLPDLGKATTESWRTAASAISSIGGAISSIEDPAAKVVGTIGQAIATIALAYSEAMAKDKSSKSNIFLFMATAAATMVSLATTISSLHSATGYAQGGVVEGNTYSGDQIPATLNAGEVVLNRAQAGNLASQLQDGKNGMNIVGRLEGEHILLVANRSLRRAGKGELVTWTD